MTYPAGDQETPFPELLPPKRTNVTLLSVNEGLARYYKFKPSAEEDREAGTLLVIMAGTDTAPVYRASIVWKDRLTYYVKAFDVLAPNGTPILYFMELVR